jgi:hypothetical protein
MTNTLRYRTSNDFLVPISGFVFSKNGPTAIAPRRISIGFEGTKEELLEQMRVRTILRHLHMSKSLENGWKIWKSLEIFGNIVRISDKTGGHVFCGNRFLMIMNSKGDLRGGQITLGSVCCCPGPARRQRCKIRSSAGVVRCVLRSEEKYTMTYHGHDFVGFLEC